MTYRNSCYTYFRIVGCFDPDTVTSLLQNAPERSWKVGDLRPNGTRYDFSAWCGSFCREYDLETGNQMRKSIAPFTEKVELLNQIRKDFDASFYLEVVPELYAGETTPCLAPPLDVIDFCHDTRTEIDVDLILHK